MDEEIYFPNEFSSLWSTQLPTIQSATTEPKSTSIPSCYQDTTSSLDQIINETIQSTAFATLQYQNDDTFIFPSIMETNEYGNAMYTSTTSSRLIQLGENYERKKERAKLNREDLNLKFQELMKILHLKEDRKVNRAKILEIAITHIQQLTNELMNTKNKLEKVVKAIGNQDETMDSHTMQYKDKNQICDATKSATFMPMPAMFPMMWSAYPTLPYSIPMANLPTLPSSTDMSGGVRKKRKLKSSKKMGVKRIRSMENDQKHLLDFINMEFPLVLQYCDAFTLQKLGQVDHKRHALLFSAKCDTLWKDLVLKRWKFEEKKSTTLYYELYKHWHIQNQPPRILCLETRAFSTSSVLLLAKGYSQGISTWCYLSKRSNHRTTRTIMENGRPTVRQIVQIHILIQNNHPTNVLSNILQSQATVLLETPKSQTLTQHKTFQLDGPSPGIPQILEKNGHSVETFGTINNSSDKLYHGGYAVLSVFSECKGMDMEDEFVESLQRIELRTECYEANTKQNVKSHTIIALSSHKSGKSIRASA